MKLLIFDIDGTIVDSVDADDRCFISTFKELHQVELGNADWNDFTNVTDSGLTIEIFQKWFNRHPKDEEIETIKSHFRNLLEHHTDQFVEIEGALSFIELVSRQPELEIGFATGGWKETAEVKCNSIGLALNNYIFKSSNDHFNRGKIIELVIEEAQVKQKTTFESITYFGDGLWDLRTTRTIGINFIGVDSKDKGLLRENGAESVIKSFEDPERILKCIGEEARKPY